MGFMISSDAMIAKAFYAVFSRAPRGTLIIAPPRGAKMLFHGAQSGVTAELVIHDWKAVRMVFLRGDIGFGEGYIDGLWSTPDLPKLMTYMVENLDEIEDVSHGSWAMQRVFQLVNWVRDNSRAGSRKNIRAHYDVGNEFYALWLDSSMTYSSAIFYGDYSQSLLAAQHTKYRRLLDRLGAPGHVLEIGCGWGGFAEAAVLLNFQVTGLTLSQAQLDYAKARIKTAKLEDKVELRFEDYRDVTGSFDYIVSIEMFEAVGEKYWSNYFQTIKNRMKENGKAMIQTITIDDAHFDAYRKRSDFIRHYTFPGGLLPSMQRLREEITAAGLKCNEVYHFGLDYAETCSRWLATLNEKSEMIKSLGYSEEFLRSWRFYLSCCIGAFAAGRTDVVQLEITHA